MELRLRRSTAAPWPRAAIVVATLVGALALTGGCSVRGARGYRIAKDGGIPSASRAGVYYSLPRTVVVVDVSVRRDAVSLTSLGRRVADAEAAVRGKGGTVASLESERLKNIDRFVSAERARAALEPTRVEAQGRKESAERKQKAIAAEIAKMNPTPTSDEDKKELELAKKSNEEAKGALEAAKGALAELQSETDKLDAAVASALVDLRSPTIRSADADWSRTNLGVDLGEMRAKEIAGPKYRLVEAKIASRAEPDEAQTFFLDLDGSATEDRELTLGLSELGLLTGAHAKVDDKTGATVVSIAQAVAKVGVAGLKFAGAALAGATPRTTAESERFSSSIPPDALAFAARLEEIRAARLEFVKEKQGSISAEAAKAVHEAFEVEERRIISQFVESETKIWTLRYEARPDGVGTCATSCGPSFSRELFDLSDLDGVEPKDPAVRRALAGAFNAAANKSKRTAPKKTDGKANGGTADDSGTSTRPDPTIVPVRLRVEYDPASQPPERVGRAATELGADERGIHYRVPALGVVRILSGDGADERELASARVAVAQWGAVAALPARLRGSGFSYDVEIHEAVGAIKKVEMKSTATKAGETATGTAGALESLMGGISDYEKARKAADKEPTELELLESERKILEEMKKIKDLKDYLGIKDE